MQNLVPILSIIFFAYLIFSRKGGGMGCCGGHMAPEPKRRETVDPNFTKSDDNGQPQIIDLREDQYRVIKTEEIRHRNG